MTKGRKSDLRPFVMVGSYKKEYLRGKSSIEQNGSITMQNAKNRIVELNKLNNNSQ